MRNIKELRKLPLDEMTDEEAVKALHDKLQSSMTMLVYMDEAGQSFFLYRHKDEQGREFSKKLIDAFQSKYGKLKKLEDM